MRGPEKAHDFTNLFTILFLITVNFAGRAESLGFHKGTAVDPLTGIVCQFLTFRTQIPRMMFFSAVDGNHLVDHLFFLLNVSSQLTLARGNPPFFIS